MYPSIVKSDTGWGTVGITYRLKKEVQLKVVEVAVLSLDYCGLWTGL